ncbi:MAG: phosphotransferase [Granulosicoccaceae bacterium]
MSIAALDVWPTVLRHVGATQVHQLQTLQSLWSGYGSIIRVTTNSAAYPTLIVKHIQAPKTQQYRGTPGASNWQGKASNTRKLHSYQVEANWYRHFAKGCAAQCVMPELLYLHEDAGYQLIVMSDLDVHYPDRYSVLPIEFAKVCLQWLARFHADHLGNAGEGLWSTGCYWHLETRQGELQAMAGGPLKEAAYALDEALAHCSNKTLVHGDAKVANFCFDSLEPSVAAVDFQYVGVGCGMKDVAYFMGSCLSAEQCSDSEAELLQAYFTEMSRLLPSSTMAPLEAEWRQMYSIAWADFNRFLEGWMPGHVKIDSYMRQQTAQALKLV